MLFNSTIFIAVFLPTALLGWYLLQRLENPVWAKVFLIGMSCWFYGYYNVWYLAVLSGSVLLNHGVSILFERCPGLRGRKILLLSGLSANIGLLFYFKYFNFFLDNCNFFFHTSWQFEKIALPLGISFFTFQQISYLIDRYHKEAPCYGFWDYACFVTFFPQLIAGPIMLHGEWIPQLQERKNRRVDAELFFDGITLFIAGFGKKVLLADVLAIIVNAEYEIIPYLDAPSAWITIICYMLELYFDFSGYCDMARGIGKMFGFWLPQNFDSPLMAVSVRDFWKRWHMTLSRFLTTYIYIPLGGNRKGKAITCRNVMIVFLVSGIWHGANWTYVLWGALHGMAMVWEILFPGLRWKWDWLNRLTTGLFVTVSFSIFRSETISSALLLLKKLFWGGNSGFFVGMCNTLVIPETYVIRQVLELVAPQLFNPFYVFCVVLLLAIAIRFVIGCKAEQWIEQKGRTKAGLFGLAFVFVWAFISLSQVSTFLYFDF